MFPYISIETNKFHWLNHTKLLTPMKRMEGLDQNELTHGAVQPACQAAHAQLHLSRFKCIVSLDSFVLQMQKMSHFSVSCSLSTNIKHSAML